jgi:hypothetical protein
MNKSIKLSYLFLSSAVAALAIGVVPAYLETIENKALIIPLILVLFSVWCWVVITAFTSYKGRAWWVLLTAPIALQWPISVAMAFIRPWLGLHLR